MPLTRNLQGVGTGAAQARAIVGVMDRPPSALGTNRATAYLLSEDVTIFTTVPSGSGAALRPNTGENDVYTVINNGANPVLVYPPTDGRIGNGAVAAAFSVPAGAVYDFQSLGFNVFIARPGSNYAAALVSVRDFGAVGDGVANDDAAVQAAVAYAYSIGGILNWSAGTYLTTANIPNFHNIQHMGSGIVKRGTDLWYISGIVHRNIIYVAAPGTGIATNDGLSSLQPCSLDQGALNLYNWPQQLLNSGIFRVKLAAGTYGGIPRMHGLRSQNSIEFVGPDVGGSPNVPTAIIDGTGASLQNGMYFQQSMFIYVQDIKFQNWTTDGNSQGLTASNGCEVFTVNVHGGICAYGAINVEDRCILRVSGGVINNPMSYAIRVYSNCTYTIGYDGGPSANRPQITGPTSGGFGAILAANNSNGHVDYTDISGATDTGGAIQVSGQSRAHTVGCTFSGNYYNIRLDTHSTHIDTGSTFGAATARSNVQFGFSLDADNNQFVYFDKATGRIRFGLATNITPSVPFLFQTASASIAAYAADVQMAIENSGNCYFAIGAGATNTAGIHFGKTGAASRGQITYNLNTDVMSLNVNGVAMINATSTAAGIGTGANAASKLLVGGSITGTATMISAYIGGTFQTDVSAAHGARTVLFTAANSTTASVAHYYAAPVGLGSSATLTNQYCFITGSGFTQATNNYGFYGQLAAALNTWNLYMTGTAPNFLQGELGIGIASSASTQLALAASTTAKSSLRITHGAAPTSPVDGDMWTTTAGLFIRINGVTKTVTLT